MRIPVARAHEQKVVRGTVLWSYVRVRLAAAGSSPSTGVSPENLPREPIGAAAHDYICRLNPLGSVAHARMCVAMGEGGWSRGADADCHFVRNPDLCLAA